MLAKQHAEFITITCLNWAPILKDDVFKDIITNSLSFLSKADKIAVYGFVIMNNHFHLIWQILNDHIREDVQRDFLKFTSQQILKHLRNADSPLLDDLFVGAKDRRYQLWERNSLSIPLWSAGVFEQKLSYIHSNPVKAGLCQYQEDYKYSSAEFYDKNINRWDFLVHHEG